MEVQLQPLEFQQQMLGTARKLYSVILKTRLFYEIIFNFHFRFLLRMSVTEKTFFNPNSLISFVTSFCKNNTLDPNLINGKIVICTIEKFTDKRGEKAIIIRQGGGVGMILIDHNAKEVGFQFVIPTTLIGQDAVEELQAYINTDK
jgi:hypothetical protein